MNSSRGMGKFTIGSRTDAVVFERGRNTRRRDERKAFMSNTQDQRWCRVAGVVSSERGLT